jgi:hypothetical protein
MKNALMIAPIATGDKLKSLAIYGIAVEMTIRSR